MRDDTLLERRYRLLGAASPLFYSRPLHLVRGDGVHVRVEVDEAVVEVGAGPGHAAGAPAHRHGRDAVRQGGRHFARHKANFEPGTVRRLG